MRLFDPTETVAGAVRNGCSDGCSDGRSDGAATVEMREDGLSVGRLGGGPPLLMISSYSARIGSEYPGPHGSTFALIVELFR